MNKTPPVAERIPLTHARANLGKLARRAYISRDLFILEKDGIPLAGILGIEDVEDYLELKNPKLKKQIAKGHREYIKGLARPRR
jgi:hypothetical protein